MRDATRRVAVCMGCEHLQMEAQFGFSEKMLCGFGHPFPESLRPARESDSSHPSAGEFENHLAGTWCPRGDAHVTLNRLREL